MTARQINHYRRLRSRMATFGRGLAIFCGFIAFPLANAQASRGAYATGTVVEASSGMPVSGAKLQVGRITATSNSEGIFAFGDLPVGKTVFAIRSEGHLPAEKVVTLVAGSNQLGHIELEASAVKLEDMAVTAPTSEAQNKFDDKSSTDGLTEILSDQNLKNPNAQNTADLMKDVSGVAVSKSNGSSNVSIRGIDQRMLRITVDGQRQGGTGNPLDSIPAEIVQSLEVTKTFTPDMEADAVGGVINVSTGGIVLKDAYTQGRHQVTYNTIDPQPGTRNSLTIGQPFKLFAEERNASVMFNASFDDQRKARERISTLREWTAQISPGPAPYTGMAIPVLTLPLIESTQEHRQRTGFVMNADARFDNVVVFWRSNYNRDWAERNRNYNDTDPSSGTPLVLTPMFGTFSNVQSSRRNQEQISKRDAINASFGGKTKVGRNDIDATVAYVTTKEEEPRTLESGFLSDRTYRVSYDLSPDPYAPTYTLIDETNAADLTSVSDPRHYRFDYLNVTHAITDEHDASLKFNWRFNLADGASYWKAGFKAQQRERTANVDRNVYDAGVPRDMDGLVGTPLVTLDTFNYSFGPVQSSESVANLLSTQPSALLLNSTQTAVNSATGDSTITEKIWAIYAMGKFRFNAWSLLGGVRVEGTRVASSGYQMLLDTNGQLQGFNFVEANNDYVEILPGLHLRYEPTTGRLYRASVTRSMSRPGNADIAPYRTLSFIDHRSRIGAPDLKPYLATNFDLSVDQYNPKYGLVSFAVFYKKIDHFITDAQYPVTIGNLGQFIEFKRVNGETALAMGFELSWQSSTWHLPWTLGKGSLEANYSFNHGEAHHATRPNETFPLPRQVDNQARVKFHDDRGPLSMDIGVSYRSGWWEDLIAEDFDNYIESAWDAEISASYKLGKITRLTAGINNVLNRPTRHYAGSRLRMNDAQFNGIDINIGLQWKL